MSLSFIKRLLLLAFPIMGLPGGLARAQDVVDVKVPFDFLVKTRRSITSWIPRELRRRVRFDFQLVRGRSI